MSTFLQDCSLLQASGPVHAARVPDDLLLRRLTHSFDGNLGRYVEQCTECLGLYRLRDRKFPVLLERELGLIFLFESGQLWQVVDGRRVFAEAIGRNRKMTERISSEATTKPSRPLVKLAWLGLPLLLYLVAWQYRLQLPRSLMYIACPRTAPLLPRPEQAVPLRALLARRRLALNKTARRQFFAPNEQHVQRQWPTFAFLSSFVAMFVGILIMWLPGPRSRAQKCLGQRRGRSSAAGVAPSDVVSSASLSLYRSANYGPVLYNCQREVVSSSAATHLPDKRPNDHAGEDVELRPTTLFLGEHVLGSNMALNVNDCLDCCPVCCESFQDRLWETYCAVLPCKHAMCLPCTLQWDAKQEPTCPMCRQSFGWSAESAIDEQSVRYVQRLLGLVSGIPKRQHLSLVQSLLHGNGFVLSKVTEALEDVLVGTFRMSSGDAEIERKLRGVLGGLRASERSLRLQRQNGSSEVTQKCKTRLQERRRRLVKTLLLARTVCAVRSEWAVDYRSLTVDQVRSKFKQLILPVLPCLGDVSIHLDGAVPVTGASIRQSIQDYIQGQVDEAIRASVACECSMGQQGVVKVVWKAEALKEWLA